MSLVSLARSDRRTSSAIPPLSTHLPGSALWRRATTRSKTTLRRSRSRATPVVSDWVRSRCSRAVRSA
jgi:NAD dependent epimerase/dehydratase family enzyme